MERSGYMDVVKDKVKELSALICTKCNVKDYTKCASECKIHKLINEILEALG
jgi:hypothetical protein